MYIRKPAVAGMFYPNDKNILNDQLEKYLDDARHDSDKSNIKYKDKILGLISPHAGYMYSGPIAAYAFSQIIDAEIDLVLVLAPFHQGRFQGASVIPEGIYKTPLGEIEIDGILGKKLLQEEYFSFIEQIHSNEHSLEVQIPFLQKSLKQFKLVPIIIGFSDIDICNILAENLFKYLKTEKRKFIIVISTDLSHYHSYEAATKKDYKLIKILEKFNEKELLEEVMNGTIEACGIFPLITGLICLKKLQANTIKVLKYANSGDTAGDKEKVVGYLSATFLKK